jgi:predicted PurR-regulated permease PerM
MPRKVEISHRTIVFTFVFIGFIWLIYLIRDLILQLLMAVFITTIFDPTVTKLASRGVPRSLSVLLIYAIVFGFIGISLASLFPVIISQTQSFIANFPTFLDRIGLSIASGDVADKAVEQLAALPQSIASTTVSFFSNILGIVTILIFAFYMLSEKATLYNQIVSFFGEERKKDISESISLVEDRIGKWSRAELVLMLMVGCANYIGLTLLGIPFSLPLSILAGILEIVPFIGPIIAAIPAVIIGFGISPISGIATAALATLIQQAESYVLVPKVMQKNVGVNPVITLISIAIGAKLAGIIGILLAVPIYISVEVLVKRYYGVLPSEKLDSVS